jgi:hypothetical protein
MDGDKGSGGEFAEFRGMRRSRTKYTQALVEVFPVTVVLAIHIVREHRRRPRLVHKGILQQGVVVVDRRIDHMTQRSVLDLARLPPSH